MEFPRNRDFIYWVTSVPVIFLFQNEEQPNIIYHAYNMLIITLLLIVKTINANIHKLCNIHTYVSKIWEEIKEQSLKLYLWKLCWNFLSLSRRTRIQNLSRSDIPNLLSILGFQHGVYQPGFANFIEIIFLLFCWFCAQMTDKDCFLFHGEQRIDKRINKPLKIFKLDTHACFVVDATRMKWINKRWQNVWQFYINLIQKSFHLPDAFRCILLQRQTFWISDSEVSWECDRQRGCLSRINLERSLLSWNDSTMS